MMYTPRLKSLFTARFVGVIRVLLTLSLSGTPAYFSVESLVPGIPCVKFNPEPHSALGFLFVLLGRGVSDFNDVRYFF